IDITVTNSSGTSPVVTADRFTFVAPPIINSISPIAGSVDGGTSVTILGDGFTNASSVKFGSTAASPYTVNSDTQITVTSPAQSAGTVDISVTTVGGTSAATPSDQFTYVLAPVVTSISPTLGPSAGGTSVTITGAHFTGATAVYFGSYAAPSF